MTPFDSLVDKTASGIKDGRTCSESSGIKGTNAAKRVTRSWGRSDCQLGLISWVNVYAQTHPLGSVGNLGSTLEDRFDHVAFTAS